MKPRSCRQSTITCVSSLHNAPEMTLSPSANAARTRTRLVMLLEPGTVISAFTGPVSGTISIQAGSGIFRGRLNEARLATKVLLHEAKKDNEGTKKMV